MMSHLEVRCERNADGTFSAAAWDSGKKLEAGEYGGMFLVHHGTCLDVQRLFAAVRREYPGIKIDLYGPCRDCKQ